MHGGNLAWAATIAGCPPSSILDFSASINPLGPPISAIAAIQASLASLQHYPDPLQGELRQALSIFHQVPPEWILPGNGAAELLTWAGRDLAQQSATYLLTPAFADYERSLTSFGASVRSRPLALPQSEIDLADSPLQLWLSSLTDLPTSPDPSDCGLLLNNPHNPTGWLWTRDAIRPYLDRFALVIIDEAFMDFLPPDRQQSCIDWVREFPNLVVVRSLTKFYSLPGLRIGYAISNPNRWQRWQRWRDPWSVNSLATAAAIAALQDSEFQQQTWAWLEAARSQLKQGIDQLPGLSPLPSAANFLLVRCQLSSTVLQEQLLKRDRIAIRDCITFPELRDRYFRIAVRTEAENQRLLTGLAAILQSSDE